MMGLDELDGIALTNQARVLSHPLVAMEDLHLFGLLVHRHLLAQEAFRDRVAVGVLCSALHRTPYVESRNMLSL